MSDNQAEHGDAYEGDDYDDGTSEEAENKIRAGIYKGRVAAGSGGDEAWGGSEESPQVALDIDLPEIGRRVTSYLSFHPNAREFSVARLKACGWDGSGTLPLVGIEKNEVSVEIKYESYQGKTSMKAEIKTLGRFKHALEPAKARSFMADLVKHAALVDGAPGGTPRPGAHGPTGGAKGYPDDWDKGKPADPARSGKVEL